MSAGTGVKMQHIHMLDSKTIDQIAAGEVVERPLAVVKELVENAIDAKATAITVEISDGGTSLIRVTDNGTGVDKEDIRAAFLRHSTSKLTRIDQLHSITSLGFRGEALASVSSVAKVEMVTKTRESLCGIHYRMEGGVEQELSEVGCPDGTTLLVRSLFYNTPARKKFLKSNQTEANYIVELVERLAVSHPMVSFQLISQNQNRFHTSGNGLVKDVIYQIYGRDIAMNLIEVKETGISGMIGKPVVSRGNRGLMNYYVNGRYIKNRVIDRAIEMAYKPYMMLRKFPFVVLFLEIDPATVDINVHPTKKEVRFDDEEVIYQLVYRALKNSLVRQEYIVKTTLFDGNDRQKKTKEEAVLPVAPEPFEQMRRKEQKAVTAIPALSEPVLAGEQAKLEKPGELAKRAEQNQTRSLSGRYEQQGLEEGILPEALEKKAGRGLSEEELSRIDALAKAPALVPDGFYVPEMKAPSFVREGREYHTEETKTVSNAEPKSAMNIGSGSAAAVQMELFEDKILSETARKEYRILGQVFDTYWLVEYRNELLMIDQHAAHEKVLYERNLKAWEEKTMTSQQLFPPQILSVQPREEQILQSLLPDFTSLGYEIEHFGGKEYAVRAVPADLYGLDQMELLTLVLGELLHDSHEKNPKMLLAKLASMSCKAAIKGGDRISVKEAEHLIDQLLALENPYHCPHGRPTMISLSRQELEKKFKRIV